jgi:hypothetical protein
MKTERYSLDRFYILPTIVYYHDIDWNGYNSIDICFLKWGISFIIREKKWD